LTTTEEVIESTLKKFRLDPPEPSKYKLIFIQGISNLYFPFQKEKKEKKRKKMKSTQMKS